jgi:hypothetical protein
METKDFNALHGDVYKIYVPGQVDRDEKGFLINPEWDDGSENWIKENQND